MTEPPRVARRRAFASLSLVLPLAWGGLSPPARALPDGPPPEARPNILLLVADDLGIDNVSVYAAHPKPAHTPNLAGLAGDGVLFTTAWADPVCSPTRATILTGRYGWRTGLGGALAGANSGVLKLEETTLPELLAPLGYTCAAVGKWHLGNDPQHPLQSGFAHHRGSISSIPSDAGGLGGGYYHYSKIVDGVPIESFTYATTETTDDALEFVTTLPEPWFVYVGFNAPHVPFHKPPPELHPYELPEEIVGNEAIHSKAMISALDAELGRLLAGVDLDDTVVVFTSDNGPDPRAVTPPWNAIHCKGTVFEQGVRVPLIVAGRDVPRGDRCSAPVNTTDLFATVVELAGGDARTGTDAVSLVPYLADPHRPPLRQTVYSETFMPNFDPALGSPGVFARHQRAVRGRRYKLIHEYDHNSPQLAEGGRRLHDLLVDDYEKVNLLDFPLGPQAAAAYQDLKVAMVQLGPPPWVDLQMGLAGAGGEPMLAALGSLVDGAPIGFEVSNAAPGALGFLVVGLDLLQAPLLCGTLVPSLDHVLLLPTDATGTMQVGTLCPPALPQAYALLFQYWLPDPTGPCGWTASNALAGLTPP